MKLSIYLHKDRVEILRTYGNLSDVVNKILDASDEGYFDVENKPECEPREGASRYDIEVTNENYLAMLKVYGIKSKTISLRRLIYWFVDNEIYSDIGWECVNDYVDEKSTKINNCLMKINSLLDKLSLLVNDERGIVDIKCKLDMYRR